MSQRFLHFVSLQDFVLFYDVQFRLSVFVNIFSYNIIFPNIIQIWNIFLVYQFSEFVYNIAFDPSTRIHNQYSPDHEIDRTYYHFARVKIDNVSFFSGDSIFAFLLFIMDRVINILRRQKGMLQLKVVLVLVCFVSSSAIFK